MTSPATDSAGRDDARGPAVWGSAASILGARLLKAAPFILLLALCGAVAGPFALSFYTFQSQATAQVVIDPRSVQVFPNEQGGPLIDANAGVNFVETQLQLFTSERVLLRVVRMDDKGGGAEKAADDIGLRPSLGSVASEDELREITALRRTLTVKRGERSFLVDVTAKAPTPERAAWTANAVVKAFIAEDTAARAESGRKLNAEIAGRLTSLRDQLEKSESQAEAFRADNGLLSSGGDKLVSEQRLEQAVQELGEAQDRVSRASARVSQLETARMDVASLGPLTAADDMRTISFLIERLSAAQEALADARLHLGPRHPTYESARGRAAEIERRIQVEVNRIRDAEKASLTRARGELTSAQKNVNDLSATVAKDRKASVQLRALYAQVKANQDLLQTFEARAREAGEFSRVTPTNIRIASEATPNQPTSRLTVAIALAVIGAIIGAMIGIAITAFGVFLRPTRVAAAGRRPAGGAG